MSYLDKSALQVVGTRPIRPDGVDKVTGRANFGADMTMPGMLWGRIKRSPHAHARIVSINTEKARALPGVKAVLTAEICLTFIGGAHFGDGPMNFATCHGISWRGERCFTRAMRSAVAAPRLIAEQALDLIEVGYEVLPHVIEPKRRWPGRADPARRLFTTGIDQSRRNPRISPRS